MEKIKNAARVDLNSKLGTYLLVNLELEVLVFDKKLDFQGTLSNWMS